MLPFGGPAANWFGPDARCHEGKVGAVEEKRLKMENTVHSNRAQAALYLDAVICADIVTGDR
jgi:hypothetical protein